MRDRSNQQIGNYRILRLLGQGGFAEVYLGEHIYLKTHVAIKILHTYLAQKELQGFLQEAQTIAHLKHPNIIQIFDFGVDDTPFLVMDYLSKGTLRQRHPEGTKLPLPLVVSYVKQIATALQHAHDARIIHRDVKPENMLVGSNDEIILSDFGLATAAHSSRSLQTVNPSGTPHYMAPELIEGKPRPASDQYALGVIVYEWLCGVRPFHGNLFSLMYQHMHDPAPPLRGKASTVPPDVEHVVHQALMKDPQRRFATIQAFARALEQASQPQAVPEVASPRNPVPPDGKMLVKQAGHAHHTQILRLTAATKTDVGHQPIFNEDSAYERIESFEEGDHGLLIVADGMTGNEAKYRCGDVASKLTIEVMSSVLDDLFHPPFGQLSQKARQFSETPLPYLVEERFKISIELANKAILQYSEKQSSARGLGCTLTATLILHEKAYIANIGDSRTYLLRNDVLMPLTIDHTLVAKLVEAGQIEPDDIYAHPQRDLIYRLLGAGNKNIEVDIFHEILHPGDMLLLCSDGLWKMVRDADLYKILSEKASPQQICDRLIDMANANGGEDNITAVVVQVSTR